MILNLEDQPEDPVQAIIWLDGVMAAVKNELDYAFQEAYFDARLKGLLPHLLEMRLHPRKRIMAWTRHANEARNRSVRWNDGLR